MVSTSKEEIVENETKTDEEKVKGYWVDRHGTVHFTSGHAEARELKKREVEEGD